MAGLGIPLIFLPGLNGDGRVLVRQVEEFDGMRVAEWERPGRLETLEEYGVRMARAVDPGEPCVVGGVSFGGIVAMEMSRHLDARLCVLIASSRDVAGMPGLVRALRLVGAVVGARVLDWVIGCGAGSAARVDARVRKIAEGELEFRKWALGAMARCDGPVGLRCPVVQIHGGKDSVFPAGRSNADKVVEGAGHLMTVTHAGEVNEFIRAVVERYACCGGS